MEEESVSPIAKQWSANHFYYIPISIKMFEHALLIYIFTDLLYMSQDVKMRHCLSFILKTQD